MSSTIAEFDINYAYNQFLICDESSGRCIPPWTEQHFRQGFSRGLSAAGFITLDQWGIGHVKVRKTPYEDTTIFSRLIAVPFFAESGRIGIQGPEEPPPTLFSVEGGHYKLWVGQSLVGEGEEQIDLFLESCSLGVEKSEILIKDEFLDPGAELLEH